MDAQVDKRTALAPQTRAHADLIAIVDIGKTNTKLALLEAGTGRIAWHAEQAMHSIQGPVLRELDVAGIERWIVSALASAPHKERIRTLVPISHGAAAVLLDAKSRVLIAPDYEDQAFELVAEPYRLERDAFTATFSPWLPLGLNLGRQLFFVEHRLPALFERTTSILTLPQYWAARFCGVAACEVTSLGCHTDLWHPVAAQFSWLAQKRDWTRLFAPLRAAGDTLGTIAPAFATATGLHSDCRVLCGLHDSNASYLAHAAARRGDRDLAVVSSGTWTVIMADRGSLDCLQESRDMLANVDAFGTPVATARFMGGREYIAIAGQSGMQATAARPALERVLDSGAMALPCFADAGGPFAGRRGSVLAGDHLTAGERASLATLYIALMTDMRLDELGAGNSIVIDGPLAANPIYGPILRTLRKDSQVAVGDARLATCSAAHYLATGTLLARAAPDLIEPIDSKALLDHRDRWRREVARLS